MEKSVDTNIGELKMKRYFNQVDWNKLKEFIELKEFKKANQVEVDLVNGTVAVDD